VLPQTQPLPLPAVAGCAGGLCPPFASNPSGSSIPNVSAAAGSGELESAATLPTLRSCRVMYEMWVDGNRDSTGVIEYHPPSLLCDRAELQKLFPGARLRADAVRATRYKRVAQEIADVGGIEEFEKKWGERIVSNVYKSLTTGSSKGRGGKKMRAV